MTSWYTAVDHDHNLTWLLQRASEKNLNKDKVKLRLTSIKYIGHLLTAEGLKPDPKKVEAVQQMPPSTDAKVVHRLLGFVNYSAKFLPHLSDVCEPLGWLTNKECAVGMASST